MCVHKMLPLSESREQKMIRAEHTLYLAKSHLEQKSRYTKIAAYYEILYKINVGGEAKAAACAQ